MTSCKGVCSKTMFGSKLVKLGLIVFAAMMAVSWFAKPKSLNAGIEDLVINHPKIASKDVLVKKARFDYHCIIGERFMMLDSTSTAQLNNIKCHPFVSYTNETDEVYALKLKIPKMKAQDFILSLPTGLFRHFEGMEAQGNFRYTLNFEYKIC